MQQVLSPLTTSQNAYDAEPDQKWFHVTIANRLGSDQASAVYLQLTGQDEKIPAREEVQTEKTRAAPEVPLRICTEPVPDKAEEKPVRTIPPVLLDETGIRITVMKDMAILAEYDLIEKRWVFGDHRHSTARWQKTLGQFRHHAGFEHHDPEPAPGR